MIATKSVETFIKLDEEKEEEEMDSESSDEVEPEAGTEVETASPKVVKKKVPIAISGSRASVEDQVIELSIYLFSEPSAFLGLVKIFRALIFRNLNLDFQL